MAAQLAQAADLEGRAPDNQNAVAGAMGSPGNGGVNNNYEASFNIQFSGGTASTSEQHNIKAAIMQALSEWAESMQRTSPQMVEA